MCLSFEPIGYHTTTDDATAAIVCATYAKPEREDNFGLFCER